MKTGKRTLRGAHSALSIVRLFTGSPARSLRRGSPKARLRAAMTSLPAPLVDLLLDGFSLLIRDNAPGIDITTLQELADALTSQHRGVALQGELHQLEVPLA